MTVRAPVNVGIVGLGMFGLEHVKSFAANRRCRVLGIATRDPDRLRAVSREYGVPHATEDYRELLRDPALSAVAICTPPHTHYEYGKAAITAGKHLLLEKPLATSASQGARLVAAARRRPGLVFSGCTARYANLSPRYAAVLEVIASGRLGEIYMVHHRSVARRSRPGIEYNPPAKWFLSRSLAGGGPLLDLGVYDLAYHLGLLGDPALRSVSAFCRNGLDRVRHGAPVLDVEEHGAAWLGFQGGLSYYWERASNAHAEAPHQSTFYGTCGGLELGYFPWDPPELRIFGVEGQGDGALSTEVRRIPEAPVVASRDVDGLVEAFLGAILDRTPLPVEPATEVKNLHIIERVYAAAGWA